jgi:hypothetical protein
MTMVDFMSGFARLTGAIYYISPDFRTWYVDVDTASTDYVLTDHPTEPNHIGYRELTHNSNGSDLANDALIWAQEPGSNRTFFSRTTDSDSIIDHGLWQWGELAQGYNQSGVEKRSESVVCGTPENKRGHKDDQVSFTCTIFHNPDMALQLGTKVLAESQVFGISDVMPIRSMVISFPTKTDVKYDLTLSHAIDEPWSIFQWALYIGGFRIGFHFDNECSDLPVPSCVIDSFSIGAFTDASDANGLPTGRHWCVPGPS